MSLVCLCAEVIAGTKLKDFKTKVDTDPEIQSEIARLRDEVQDYAKQFPTIGFEKSSMKYQHWTWPVQCWCQQFME